MYPKVTIILKDSEGVVTIWNVTYILYRSDVSLIVMEDHNTEHKFLLKNIETMDMEYSE